MFIVPPLQSLWSALGVDFLFWSSLLSFPTLHNFTYKKGMRAHASFGHFSVHFLVSGSTDTLHWDFCAACHHPRGTTTAQPECAAAMPSLKPVSAIGSNLEPCLPRTFLQPQSPMNFVSLFYCF